MMVLNKIKGVILGASAFIMHFLSVYGLNYRSYLSDITYHKGKKLVDNIKQ